MSSIKKLYASGLSTDWNWIEVTLAGFHGNTLPHPSCLKPASENFNVNCFQVPSDGMLNCSPKSSEHLLVSESTQSPPSSTLVLIFIGIFIRTCVSESVTAIAQKVTPVN